MRLMSRAAAYLMSQYHLRKKKNARYSQRAFSKMLGINSGKLSQYFLGQRLISRTVGRNFAVKLDLDKEQTAYFLYLCDIDKSNRETPGVKTLRDDQLSLIVEWHHFAILSLVSTTDFRLDHKWIAERLGIPVSFVESSLKCLQRIGMIRIEDGKVLLTPGPLTTSEDVPNEFLLLSHQETIRHVADHLPKVPVDKRDVSSVTLAIDQKKLPQAKKAIRAFRRKLAGLMARGSRDQVYTLNIQLFPFTQEVSK